MVSPYVISYSYYYIIKSLSPIILWLLSSLSPLLIIHRNITSLASTTTTRDLRTSDLSIWLREQHTTR